MKTTEEKTAVQVAQEIPCACYDCGINGLKATEMIQAYADQQVKAEREKVANEIQELKNKLNSQNIREMAHAKLNEMDQFMIKETEVIPAVVVKYYYVNHQAHAGAAFLKDVARYIESRNPALNEGKTWFQLMADFARKVDFDKTTRF